MADTGFYAYLHARPNTGSVAGIFYVGKGSGRRASNFSREYNPHYSNVVHKYGIEAILVGKLQCSTEALAFELECGLIKCLRRSRVKLTNITDGGEGTSGHHWTAGKRAEISARQVQAVQEGRHHTQNPEVLARIRAGHKKAVLEGTHSSITMNPMKRPEIAAKSKATRDKNGRHQICTEARRAKISAAAQRMLADGTHPMLRNHPSKNKEALAKMRATKTGSRNMFDLTGARRIVLAKNIAQRMLDGWVFVCKREGE